MRPFGVLGGCCEGEGCARAAFEQSEEDVVGSLLLVSLICSVSLVFLVSLVIRFRQPDRRDRLDRPNRPDRQSVSSSGGHRKFCLR